MKLFGWELRRSEPDPGEVDTRVDSLLDMADKVRADARALADGYRAAISQAGQAITRVEDAIAKLGSLVR